MFLRYRAVLPPPAKAEDGAVGPAGGKQSISNLTHKLIYVFIVSKPTHVHCNGPARPDAPLVLAVDVRDKE